MRRSPLSLTAVDAQEERLAAAFARGDISMAKDLYQPDVVYISPTTRLFGWPARIVGRDQAFEFIQVTISGLSDISYSVDERALIPDSGGDAEGAQGAGTCGCTSTSTCGRYGCVRRTWWCTATAMR